MAIQVVKEVETPANILGVGSASLQRPLVHGPVLMRSPGPRRGRLITAKL
jgi:hypothetical protein